MAGVCKIRSSRKRASSTDFSFFSRMTLVAILTNSEVNGRKIATQMTLKKVWNMAICVCGCGNQRTSVSCMKEGQHSRKTVKMIEDVYKRQFQNDATAIQSL